MVTREVGVSGLGQSIDLLEPAYRARTPHARRGDQIFALQHIKMMTHRDRSHFQPERKLRDRYVTLFFDDFENAKTSLLHAMISFTGWTGATYGQVLHLPVLQMRRQKGQVQDLPLHGFHMHPFHK